MRAWVKRLTVQEVFFIEGRGTVVCGQVESGMVRVGDEIQLKRPGFARKVTVVTIEGFRKPKTLTQAQVGDEVGIMLRWIHKQDDQQGDVLVTSHK